MNNTIALQRKDFSISNIMFDIAAILFVYLTPAISHMLSVPVYLVDPMRIVILLSLIHTSNKNTFLIALTLPVFSYFISAHPVFLKSLLITSELMLNIFLFYKLFKYIKNDFLVMFTSILLSKLFYYAAKYILINTGLLQGDLVATPMEIQVIVMLIISAYYLLINKYNVPKSEAI